MNRIFSLLLLSAIFCPFCQAREKEISSEKMVYLPDFRSVAKKAIPAVVSIKSESQQKQQTQTLPRGAQPEMEDPFDSMGRDFFEKFFGIPRREGMPSQPVIGQASGFVVSPDGYILTNSHVVQDADIITVLFSDGREFSAEVVGQDKNSDLAVVKISTQENLPFLSLGNSDDLEVGQWVCAIGNPLGLQASVTVGVVSAKGRNNLDLLQYEDFIQTDAPINRGNSGGPLMTLDGEVIGINTAIATTSAGSGYMGIGFAIPSNMAEKVMEQLITKGSVTRGFLGIALQGIDHNLAQSFGLDKVQGALVVEVKPNSPAEEAGLKREDLIISYDGRPVTNISNFRNAISFMSPGSKVVLTVLRDNKKMNVTVKIGSFADEETKEANKAEEQIGLEVEAINPEIATQLGYTGETGVIVTKVYPGSAAAKAGIKKGALIISIDRERVFQPKEFYSLVKKHDPKAPLLLLVRQGEVIRYVALKIK